ncbi:MAG: SGNH/GDSL hydrolase family protein [Microbacter sp.]
MKLFTTFFLVVVLTSRLLASEPIIFHKASDPMISYMGRGDFSNPDHPKFWVPGAQIIFRFQGDSCILHLTDQHLYGNFFNIIQIIVDGKYERLPLSKVQQVISVGSHLKDTVHTVILCKTTESNIGYLQFDGVSCHQLLSPPSLPKRKIEFIGNSITCGTGSDCSTEPCGKGAWYAQHNAYLSYGPLTARALDAQYHLTAYSGIGLMYSCCNIPFTMPQIFDKIDMMNDSLKWNFSNYQPNVVTICLGQNDGIQNEVQFCGAYIDFLTSLRKVYPHAQLVMLSSPMADSSLTRFLKKSIEQVNALMHRAGDLKVSYYFFKQRYNGGCNDHPTLAQHQKIADELTTYLKTLMHW